MSDAEIRRALISSRRVACVGFSANPARPSHYVSEFLVSRGHTVIPVNPGLAGQTFLGQRVAASLDEIEGPVDMVDIFRRSEHVPEIVDAALARGDVRVVWMQLGISHAEAAAKARAAGLTVVENRCPKIEYPRLVG